MAATVALQARTDNALVEELERLIDRVMSIKTPSMNGDNLAVTICSYFDNPDQDNISDETCWTPDAMAAYEELKVAIKDHFTPILTALRTHNDTLEDAANERIAQLEAENKRLREALRMISIVEQGCGGNLSFKEMAESAMRQARRALQETGEDRERHETKVSQEAFGRACGILGVKEMAGDK